MNIDDRLKDRSDFYEEMAVFVEAYEKKNFSKTAKSLKTQQPKISAKIALLEVRCGETLFTKVQNGVVPTTFADQLYNSLGQQLKEFARLSHDFSFRPYEGNLTVWTTDGLGSFCFADVFEQFRKDYPNINLKTSFAGDGPDISSGQVHVAIVYHEPTQAEAVEIEKYEITFGLFASQKYIQENGMPKDLEDLVKNHIICQHDEYQQVWNEWDDLVKKAKKSPICCDLSNMLVNFTNDSSGVALHPLYIKKINQNFVHVLPDFSLKHYYRLIAHKDTKDSKQNREMLNRLGKRLSEVRG